MKTTKEIDMSAAEPLSLDHDNPSGIERVVRLFYEALATGDVSLVDQALAPEWEAIPPLSTGPGAEGWKASIEHLRRVFTGLSVTIEDLLVAGDRVAVRSISRGRHSAELLGAPATGRPIEFRAFDVHRLEAGRIVQTWHLEDFFSIAMQLDLTLVRQPAMTLEGHARRA